MNHDNLDHKTERSLNGHNPLLNKLEKTVPRGSQQHYTELEARLLALLDSQKDDEPMNIALPTEKRFSRRGTTPSFSYTMAAALVAVFFGVVTLMFLRQIPPDDQYGSSSQILTSTPAATHTLVPTLLPPTVIPGGEDVQIIPPPLECYPVQAGDAPQDITERFNITIDELISLNPDIVRTCDNGAAGCIYLSVGQCLKIAAQATLPPTPVPTSTPFMSGTSADALNMIADGLRSTALPTIPPVPTEGYYQHTVQSGETLYDIASRYGYRNPDDLRLVLTANPTLESVDDITVGQVLIIPVPTGTEFPLNIDVTPTPVPFDLQPSLIPLATATPISRTGEILPIMPTVTPPSAAGELRPVVVAVIDLPANHELGSISRVRSIRTVYFPADVIPEGAYSEELDVIGKFSVRPIAAFQPITASDTVDTRPTAPVRVENTTIVTIPADKLMGVDALQKTLEGGELIDLMMGVESQPDEYYSFAPQANVIEVTSTEITVALSAEEAAILDWLLALPVEIRYWVHQ